MIALLGEIDDFGPEPSSIAGTVAQLNNRNSRGSAKRNCRIILQLVFAGRRQVIDFKRDRSLVLVMTELGIFPHLGAGYRAMRNLGT